MEFALANVGRRQPRALAKASSAQGVIIGHAYAVIRGESLCAVCPDLSDRSMHCLHVRIDCEAIKCFACFHSDFGSF